MGGTAGGPLSNAKVFRRVSDPLQRIEYQANRRHLFPFPISRRNRLRILRPIAARPCFVVNLRFSCQYRLIGFRMGLELAGPGPSWRMR